MPLIYITGPSGAGKSTVRNELVKRGYEAHDTDEDGISAWYDNQTLEPVEWPPEKDRSADWYEKHDYRMSTERVEELAERANTKLIFLCGIPANDKEFREYYDKIICLVIDKEVMQRRVTARTNNGFGKSPDELKLMLYWHGKMLERYGQWGATMIDATQSPNTVVDEIIRYTTEKK
jgi:adenylate kinase family enzyme